MISALQYGKSASLSVANVSKTLVVTLSNTGHVAEASYYPRTYIVPGDEQLYVNEIGIPEGNVIRSERNFRQLINSFPLSDVKIIPSGTLCEPDTSGRAQLVAKAMSGATLSVTDKREPLVFHRLPLRAFVCYMSFNRMVPVCYVGLTGMDVESEWRRVCDAYASQQVVDATVLSYEVSGAIFDAMKVIRRISPRIDVSMEHQLKLIAQCDEVLRIIVEEKGDLDGRDWIVSLKTEIGDVPEQVVIQFLATFLQEENDVQRKQLMKDVFVALL